MFPILVRGAACMPGPSPAGQTLERLDYRIKEWDVDLKAYVKQVCRPVYRVVLCCAERRQLEARKPVIVTGDLNVAHLDADIYNFQAKHVAKVPGCTPQERKSFGDWLHAGAHQLGRLTVDHAQGTSTPSASSTARPPASSPTGAPAPRLPRCADGCWCMLCRARGVNKGLRLDYFVASKALTEAGHPQCVPRRLPPAHPRSVHESFILEADTVGASDHAPVGLVVAL